MDKPSYRRTGYLETIDLERLGLIPSTERFKRGPVAIPECPELIPCNICVQACPFHAITMNSIIDLPRVDWDKCTGCGSCVALCPGLAIFVVDLSRDDGDYVTLPHEFLPRPQRGDRVHLFNRRGENIGVGEVIRVWERNKTLVVTVKVPKGLGLEVRAIWPIKGK